MFDVFITNRARQVMQQANREASHRNHGYIGTDHILLGLLKADGGGAPNVLKNLGIDTQRAIQDTEATLQELPGKAPMGALPQEMRAKKIIEYALEDMRGLEHKFIGTGHILLGFFRVQSDRPSHALAQQGFTVEAARAEIKKSLPQADPSEFND
jgi:ATP-dependent Clp protease ATP-binding subunit ClpC